MRQPHPGMDGEIVHPLLALLDQAPETSSTLSLEWDGKLIPVGTLRRKEVARRYGFVVVPVEPDRKE